MSLEKCRASAASASLFVVSAIRVSDCANGRNPRRSRRSKPRRRKDWHRFCVVAAQAAVIASTSTINGKREQETGFDQRGQRLDLGVAVLMLLVGRLVRDPDREIGEGGRCDVGEIVARLGEDRERSREQSGDEFAAVISELTAIEASAALSFSRLAPFSTLPVPRPRSPAHSDL